ncbi:MAG: c-type cytochrome [Halomonadaceae bacterium]
MHGQGTQDHFYPSLIKNVSTQGDNVNNLVMSILRGVNRQIDDYTVAMPAFDDQLNDQQIAAVSNYVLTQFGNAEQSVDAAQVAELRNGAPAPWLIRATPWLLGLAVIVILLGIVLLARVLQRRRK